MGHANSTDTSLIARITQGIAAATAQINEDTGRNFDITTAEARYFPVDGYGYELEVDEFTQVTTLKLDDDDDGVFETTIAATGYETDRVGGRRTGWPSNVVRLLDRSWPCGGRRRYTVELTATYGWQAVPAPIKQACGLLAARYAQRESSALFGTETFGELGAASIRANDPDYRNLIGPYVRPQVA